MTHKPTVVILGGCGFIGRNLVEYLIENDLVSKVRIIDKVSPEIAWLNAKHKEILNHANVEFVSGNLIHPSTCDLIFLNNNNNDITWEYVINCAAETRSGLSDEIYKQGIYKLSLNCATAAARYGILKYVELSSGQISPSSKVPLKETDDPDPWSLIAKYKIQVEKALSEIPGLNYVIVRPGIVYGKSDRSSIAQRLIIGAIYKHLNEPIQLLGRKDLPMNTIHVEDLCRGIWHILDALPNDKWYTQIYNIVDQGNSTQHDIMLHIADLFNVEFKYIGILFSNVCQLTLQSTVEDINDKHMEPWTVLCRKYNITNTPLSPYVLSDMLVIKPVHLDNTKLLNTGFTFQVPEFSKEKVQEILNDYIEMGIFPGDLITKL